MSSDALLAEQLELLGISSGFKSPEVELESARSGVLTAKISGRYLHSRHDPQREARRQAEGLPVDAPTQLLVFFGAGLGYGVVEALQMYRNPIVWFEPVGAVLEAALSQVDVRSHLRSGRLVIVPEMPSDETLEKLFQGRANADIVFALHRASINANEAYELLARRCEHYLNRKGVNLATLSRFDRVWAHNVLRNVPRLAGARPVAELFGSAPRHTAVVCGAGPSLAEDVDALAGLQDRALVIAVDTAVAVLTRAGIDPDIIVSVDPQPVNYYYLESYAGTACLVVDPTTCYLSLRSFPAAKVFVAESPVPIAKYLEQFATRPPGQVAFGGSVSTNAYDLAVQMGCRKIVLLGQDLAFTGGMAHARGAVLEGRILLREERTFRHELHNYRQLSALPVRYLPSRSGGRLPTNDKLAIFHSWFERRFATDIASGIALYNCGSEGAFLAGTKLSSLKEALGPQQPEPWRAPPPLAEPLLNLESLLADLREQLVAFDAFEELSGRAAEQARAAMQNGPGMSQNLQELDRIDERLREFQSTSRIISGAMQRTIFEITERFGDRNATGNALGQSVRLYEALAESCRLHRSWIGRLILSRPHLSPQTSVIGGCD
ncbi:MAG: motility associated factor glycosyltransferase family protein [Leptospiraceae bacterium]|nr:motility associated factor glycosyltransferase family protein [Leptospiraceae bacterium]